MSMAGTSGSSESRARKMGNLAHSRPASKQRPGVLPSSTHPDPEQEQDRSPHPKGRTGIVSVNGRDIGEMHCTGGR